MGFPLHVSWYFTCCNGEGTTAGHSCRLPSVTHVEIKIPHTNYIVMLMWYEAQ